MSNPRGRPSFKPRIAPNWKPTPPASAKPAGPSAGRRMRGSTRIARKKALVVERLPICQCCDKHTDPKYLVIHHAPKPLHEWHEDPLYREDWREHVELWCEECHAHAHGAPSRVPVSGIPSWWK